MGLLRKMLDVLGFEDKELLRAQFDALYYESVDDELKILANADPVEKQDDKSKEGE